MASYSLETIKRAFDNKTLDRGIKYQQQGCVTDFKVIGEEQWLEATVFGRTVYEVSVHNDKYGVTGDCSCPYWKPHGVFIKNQPICAGKALSLQTHWYQQENSWQLELDLDGCENWLIINVEPPHYLNTQTAEVGEISTELTARQILHFQTMPSIPAEAMGELAVGLRQYFTSEKLALPEEIIIEEITQFTPFLTAIKLHIPALGDVPAFEVSFLYGDLDVEPDYDRNAEPIRFYQHENTQFKVVRDLQAEFLTAKSLEAYDIEFLHFGDQKVWGIDAATIAESLQKTLHFVQENLAKLEKQGWLVDMSALPALEFEHLVFDFQLQDSDKNWFDFSLNLTSKDGLMMDTADVLSQWFAKGMPDELYFQYDNRWLAVDTHPLQQIQSLLVSLHGQKNFNQPLHLPNFQLA
jgi:hypothetical protein